MSVDLEAIEKRLNRRTKGKWEAKWLPGGLPPHCNAKVWIRSAGRPGIAVSLVNEVVVPGAMRLADAELIAHAPEDIRALINEVKRLRAVAEAAKMLAECDSHVVVRDEDGDVTAFMPCGECDGCRLTAALDDWETDGEETA